MQIMYLKKVLIRFNMSNYATALTSMILSTQLQKELVKKASLEVIQEYQSMMRSIMYPMIQIRPDISYAVTILSRYNHNSNAKHIAAVKRVLRYLKGTLDYDITYETVNNLRDTQTQTELPIKRPVDPWKHTSFYYTKVLSAESSSDSNSLLYPHAKPST